MTRGRLAFNSAGQLVELDSQDNEIALDLAEITVDQINTATLSNGADGDVLVLDGSGDFRIEAQSGGDLVSAQMIARRNIK